MSKLLHDDVPDGALNVIKNNANRMDYCSAAPATYAEATSTYSLAHLATVPSDFTISDGDVSGRKLRVGLIWGPDSFGAPVDAPGTATHVAFVDTGGARLLKVTELATPQAVIVGDYLLNSQWNLTFPAPV